MFLFRKSALVLKSRPLPVGPSPSDLDWKRKGSVSKEAPAGNVLQTRAKGRTKEVGGRSWGIDVGFGTEILTRWSGWRKLMVWWGMGGVGTDHIWAVLLGHWDVGRGFN